MVQKATMVNTQATKGEKIHVLLRHGGDKVKKRLTSNASRHAGNGQPCKSLKGVIRARYHVEAIANRNTASARALGSESAEGKVSA